MFLFWQPVMDYFITGTYDDNIVIQLDADNIKVNSDHKLLVVRVRAANRGNVPVKLTADGKGDLTLEIRKIDRVENGQWTNPADYPVTATRTILETTATDLMVPPGSYWAKEVSIALPNGAYWLQGTLHRKNGDQISDSTYYELGK